MSYPKWSKTSYTVLQPVGSGTLNSTPAERLRLPCVKFKAEDTRPPWGRSEKNPQSQDRGCAVYVRLTKLFPKDISTSVPQKWATQNRVLHGRKAQLPVGGQPHRVPAKINHESTASGCHTRQARPRQGAPPFHSPYTRLQTPLPVATRYISRLSSVI